MEAVSNTTSQGGASFDSGVGEQHPGGSRIRKKKKLEEVIRQRIDEYLATIDSPQLLNEISYSAYNRAVTENSPKQQISKSIKLLNRKLNEIDQLLGHSNRLKENMGENWSLNEENKLHLEQKVKQLYREIKKL